MEPVYGRKRMGANAGRGETWFDRFTQLEPAGGFRAVVQQVWNDSALTSNDAALLSSRNGSANGKAVDGERRVTANAGGAIFASSGAATPEPSATGRRVR